MRLPSLMFEMRSGAAGLTGRTAGRIGREPRSNKLETPVGSPFPIPGIADPGVPTSGGASLASVETHFGIRDGVLKIISAGLIVAAWFALTCVPATAGVSKGWPKLMGVVS